MEFDVRPHEPYDATIAALFIALMLVVTVLIFVMSGYGRRGRENPSNNAARGFRCWLLVAALLMVLAGVAIIIGLTVWPALDTGAPSTSPPEATE